MTTYTWLGHNQPHLDTMFVHDLGSMVFASFGGVTAQGAHKNEDAAAIFIDPAGAWELALVIDAHHSAQSAQLILQTVVEAESQLRDCLNQPLNQAFFSLDRALLDLFRSNSFRAQAATIQGEASCLFVARKDEYVWYWAVGDCIGYIFHPSIARLGEMQLNQRRFYEWIGNVNTWDGVLPSYSTGIRLLQPGLTTLMLTTDGLLECGKRPFEQPTTLYNTVCWQHQTLPRAARALLERVQTEGGRDSATVILWQFDSTWAGMNRDFR
ncbi:protein phosphatase 2C domain-containing protein [Herpetosiphon llansteffanensis]|uniref:protein phosphatase 2C domain-containing protein n=1 Tax=Herpetosiphon llansteffanensis TaxID=2094568 RepID=UPI000D7BEFBF|nr:protein phosphatase 2C domain-containing protein [Herpetosiphon llansteffanensis]